ncbi:hypothetical protein [Thermosyntropha lipolytica]|nr:hypothetical protein [Thermosyntropha lipolytica]
MGYLGAVIGAGFASGQEIVQFFVVYGAYGFKGALLAGGLFALLGMLLIYTAHKEGIDNYQEMLTYFLGTRWGVLVDFMLTFFLFLGISTMLAASGAVFYEHLYLSKVSGIISACLLVIIFLITGRKGLFLSYNLLVPVKLMFLVFITAYAAFIFKADQMEVYTSFMIYEEAGFWLVSSFLYVAYNFALALVVLTEYRAVTSPLTGMAGAAMGGIVLGMLIVFTYRALGNFLPHVMYYQVPMLFIAGNINIKVKYVYTVVLWLGILTTALANAYGFALRFSRLTSLNYQFCLLLCIVMAVPLSLFSFSDLVGRIYPAFGFLGLVIIWALFFKAGKDMLEQIYYNIRK